ncbi:hypothetical protein N7475_009727 [Penicillium sp. IBT 31633x]|nr:hypothetical protein N7475_009727 [Penicillium sp. IBT 31633x]
MTRTVGICSKSRILRPSCLAAGSADTSSKKLESARFLNDQHGNVAVILAVGKAGWITGLYFEKSGCCLQQVEAGINLLQH